MKAIIIVNACDLMSEDDRNTRVAQETRALANLGFHASELDLRDYCGGQQTHRELRRALSDCGLVWVRGGNVFVLRRIMRASHFDEILVEMLHRDQAAYGGYSAGIGVLTPSLRGYELVDDAYSVPNGYDSTIIWEGLKLLPYAIAPHYRSDHPESADTENVVQYFIDNHILFKALRDGQVIIFDAEGTNTLP